MSSSSRVKFSSTDTARISWYAWRSKTHGVSQCIQYQADPQSCTQRLHLLPLAYLGVQLKRFKKKKKEHQGLTSASLDDINLRTTCLRYSKLISRESLRSEVLVTVVLEVGGLGLEAGGGSGQTLSCFSARLSGNLSFPSASGSGFSFYQEQRRKRIYNIHRAEKQCTVQSNPIFLQ